MGDAQPLVKCDVMYPVVASPGSSWPHGSKSTGPSGPCRRTCGRSRRDRVADACLGAVPHDARQFGHECVDRDRGQGRRHECDRDPDRHHLLHPGDGVAHDHGRQGWPDPRPQASLRHRVRRLRLRVAGHCARGGSGHADRRMVSPRGSRGSADHAGHRRAGGVQLRTRSAPARLRTCRFGRRDRGGGRAPDRRPADYPPSKRAPGPRS